MNERGGYRYDDDQIDEDTPSLSGAAEAARRRRGEDRLYDDAPHGRGAYDGRYDPSRGGYEDEPYERDDRRRGYADDNGTDDRYGDDRYADAPRRRHLPHDGVDEMRPPRRQRRAQERVIYQGHPHWTGLLGFYFKGAATVSVGALLAYGLAKAGMFHIMWPFVGLIGGYAAVYGIGRLLITSTRYTVTTRRITKRWGIVHKHQEEASIQRIQNITVNVTLLDRVLRIGAIDFDTAAVEDMNQLRFWGVKRPFDIHGTLMADEEFSDQLY